MQHSKSTLDNLDNAPDTKGLDKGWSWAVMVASFGAFFILGGNTYAVGLIHSALLQRFEERISLTAWAGSVQNSFMCLGAPLSSFVVDKFSCRTAITLSGILFAVGYLGTAFAPNIQTAIFTCGIVAGFGAGLGYTASMVVIGFNFERKRNIALGFSLSGMGAGLFALAPLMQLALDYYGPVGFFIIQATISLNMITFGAVCFPSDLELVTQKMRRHQAQSGHSKTKFMKILKLYFKSLINKPIILLCASMFLNSVGIYLIFLHLPTYIVFQGFTSIQAAYMVSLMGILSVLGRLLTGFLANMKVVKEIWLYSGTLGLVSLGTFVYPFISDTFTGHVVFASILGLFFGSCFVLMTPLSIDYVGINYVSAAVGVQFFCGGFGAILGPVCAGVLVDNGGTYEQSIISAGVCILLAAMLSSLTVWSNPVKEEPGEYNDEKQAKRETIVKNRIFYGQQEMLTANRNISPVQLPIKLLFNQIVITLSTCPYLSVYIWISVNKCDMISIILFSSQTYALDTFYKLFIYIKCYQIILKINCFCILSR